MSVPAAFNGDFREKVCRPHRKVARVNATVVLSYGVVRNDKTAFYNVDKIKLGIGFEHVKELPYPKPIVIVRAITLAISAVELQIGVLVLFVSFSLLFHSFFDGCEVIHRSVFHTSPKLHFKAVPRKIREFHIVFADKLKGFLTKHNLLGERHIRKDGCFLLSHRTDSLSELVQETHSSVNEGS